MKIHPDCHNCVLQGYGLISSLLLTFIKELALSTPFPESIPTLLLIHHPPSPDLPSKSVIQHRQLAEEKADLKSGTRLSLPILQLVIMTLCRLQSKSIEMLAPERLWISTLWGTEHSSLIQQQNTTYRGSITALAPLCAAPTLARK